MGFALVELETGNVVGFYVSEEAALKDVAETIAAEGPGAVETLALGERTPEGTVRPIARGDGLARRALAARPAGRAVAPQIKS